MPMLRRSLHWIAILLLAVFAPVLSIAIFVAEKVRTRDKTVLVPSGDTLVALSARRSDRRRGDGTRPEGGAVILAFRPRSVPPMDAAEPPALTGSR